MDTKIDFLCRQEHFIDHLLPVWNALPDEYKGTFYIHENILQYAKSKEISGKYLYVLSPKIPGSLKVDVPGDNPILTCAYGDFLCAWKSNPNRLFMLSEHGIGLAFGENGGYAGGIGHRNHIDLFLSTNEFVANKNRQRFDTETRVVGVPKMDAWAGWFDLWNGTGEKEPVGIIKATKSSPVYSSEVKSNKTICISFHWDGSHISPEAGNAWNIFGTPECLQMLKENFNVIGHCHPKARELYKPEFEKAGIEFLDNFADVLERADIYINDCSSTMYEFLVTGKPVIIMHSPTFRKTVDFGIRFWHYTDIGKHVKNPRELSNEIKSLIENPNQYLKQRRKAVEDLFPFIGTASYKFASELIDFVRITPNMEKVMLKTDNYDVLRNVISGENNATKGISDYEIQHLAWLGSQLKIGEDAYVVDNCFGKASLCIASGAVLDYKNNIIHCAGHTEKHMQDLHYHYAKGGAIALDLKNVVKVHKLNSSEAFRAYKLNKDRMNKPNIGLLFINEPTTNEGWNTFDSWSPFVSIGGMIAIRGHHSSIESIIYNSPFWHGFNRVGNIFSARRKAYE